MMVDGTCLGDLTTLRSARLIDMYDQLMTALGGSLGYKYEPCLVSPGEVVFDGAYQNPFLSASDGDVYTLIKSDLRDTAYLDRDRLRKE